MAKREEEEKHKSKELLELEHSLAEHPEAAKYHWEKEFVKNK